MACVVVRQELTQEPDELTNHVGKALAKGRDGDGRETIDNRERGCGFLKANKAYVRSDVAALSHPDGEVPRFVVLDDPVEYREDNGQGAIIPGFKRFPGTEFALAYEGDGRTTSPKDDITASVNRLRRYGFDGEHYYTITAARSHDLLMSVGKSHWSTPEDFVVETRRMGLNLAIPTSKTQEPPVINPLRTRVWVIHPHGKTENHPAIIGYAYLSRTVFTSGSKATDDDPDVPGYVEDWEKTGKVEVVDRGEPIPAEEDSPSETLKTFSGNPGESFEDRRENLDKAFDDNALRSLVDAKGLDVDGNGRDALLDALAEAGATLQ